MKCKVLYFLIGGFFICLIVSSFLPRYKVLAEEMEEVTEDYSELEEQIDGYISSLEEDQNDDDTVLSDTFGYIQERVEGVEDETSAPDTKKKEEETSSKSKGLSNKTDNLRTLPDPVNSYNAAKNWKFDESYYLTTSYISYNYYYNGSGRIGNDNFYLFDYNAFGENTVLYISRFIREYGYQCWVNNNIIIVRAVNNSNYPIILSSYSLDNVNSYIANYGLPSDMRSVYWSDGSSVDPVPTPTPTPTITPTPEGGTTEVIYSKDFELMVIFCIGLLGGFFVGRTILGFLK